MHEREQRCARASQASLGSISCRLRRLGFALWACPVRAPARAENSNYAPISVGTAHISHGIVYIARCIPSLILPFLSALVLISEKLRTTIKKMRTSTRISQAGGSGSGEAADKRPLFRAT